MKTDQGYSAGGVENGWKKMASFAGCFRSDLRKIGTWEGECVPRAGQRSVEEGSARGGVSRTTTMRADVSTSPAPLTISFSFSSDRIEAERRVVVALNSRDNFHTCRVHLLPRLYLFGGVRFGLVYFAVFLFRRDQQGFH